MKSFLDLEFLVMSLIFSGMAEQLSQVQMTKKLQNHFMQNMLVLKNKVKKR